MMGVSHAATGLLVGVTVGAALGSHPSDLFVCAAVGAGAALLPDLDEPGSTVGRSLGGASQAVSRALRAASSAAYRATGTVYELRDGKDGGHRHLTHTVPAVGVFGALGWGLASLGSLGLGVTVFAMSALGLATVARSVRGLGSRRSAVQVAGVLAVVVAAAAVVLPGGAPWLVGVTVAVGSLVHILGDWLTRSGVPLGWPLKHRGKRWWMFRSPVAFHTGKSRVEDAIRWGCLAGAPAVAVLASVPVG
jgi:membrane-bound metal-dependent hydrolase YbcI (DUF457 family)